jgi:hypothetical protein
MERERREEGEREEERVNDGQMVTLIREWRVIIDVNNLFQEEEMELWFNHLASALIMKVYLGLLHSPPSIIP